MEDGKQTLDERGYQLQGMSIGVSDSLAVQDDCCKIQHRHTGITLAKQMQVMWKLVCKCVDGTGAQVCPNVQDSCN